MKTQIAPNAQFELVNNVTGEVMVLTFAEFTNQFGHKQVKAFLEGTDKNFTFAEVAAPKAPAAPIVAEIAEEPFDETAPVTPAKVELESDGKPTGIVDLILELHMNGLKNAEIIKLGFASGTVNRQVSEFKKRLQQSNLTIQF